MLHKIIKYNLANIPKDLMGFFREPNPGKIVVLTILYLIGVIIMLALTVAGIKADTDVSAIVYLCSLIMNLNIIVRFPHILYLNKSRKSDSIFIRLLFVLSGPFGILRACYLMACLKVMTDTELEYYHILRLYPDRWARQWEREAQEERRGRVGEGEYPNFFILSLNKYLKRLRDYS